ncbi:MAG: short-chain dehydrogenase/reductase [Verrucomicrobia bacterium]|nr:short-chain dehydrogenase/reductase [Verrucomicrobiota bacterium]
METHDPSLPTTPSFRLDGRKALVTGAGRGLGMAAAVALAEAGADVTLVARTAAEIEGVAAALRSRGLKAGAQTLDVTDFDAVREFVARHGPFRILVNNAGTNRPALLLETPDRDIDEVLNLNVNAAMVMAREVARGLKSAGLPGSIIQVSSQMGHVGGPKRAVYCASKHALEGMTKALAWEWGPDGIRVNSICPTFIRTALTRTQFNDPQFRDWVLAKIALGRLGELADIMGPVVFLAGDAAALVTGSALMVDGGWTAA